MAAPGFRLSELAERLGGRVVGDPERRVTGVAKLDRAEPGDLAFLTNARFRREAARSRAGALLVPPGVEGLEAPGRSLLVVEDPELARNRVLELFYPRPKLVPGVHPSAVVDPEALVSAEAEVGPFAVIGGGSVIAAGARIGSHTVVGRDCQVAEGSVLHPHVVLYDGTRLGRRVEVHSGTVLGADGFGYTSRPDGHHKVPQVGALWVEDDVEIGAVAALDRATLGATRVGAGTKIDNLVQVGHNVEIGRGALLCGQSGIAGSARLGDGVVLAGQAGVGDHIELGDRVQVGAASAAVRRTSAGTVVSATVPAMEIGRWRRLVSLIGRLDEIYRRLRALEDRVDEGARAAREETEID